MINPISQSFVASTKNNGVTNANKESKTNETQKTENDKVSKIAQQIQKGEYKLDMKETAKAITESLL